MQYQGGKARVSWQIAEVIDEVSRWQIENRNTNRCINRSNGGDMGSECLVSLFCGACSVESKLGGVFKRIICNDKHEYLIALLNGVKNGYELPDRISKEQYKYIRSHKNEDMVLAGFVGFGCSFGGKWFGGYTQNKTGRNYVREAKQTLLRDISSLMDATFICKDYRDVELPDGCVIYADPPYDGTTGYNNEKFDSIAFWEYMREISKEHIVFISEQTAPDDFVSIWEKPITRTLDVNKGNYFTVTEKLYIHKDTVQVLGIDAV